MNLSLLKFRKVIHDTPVSRVAIYSVDQTQFILKRTRADHCQLEVLNRLVRKRNISGEDGISVLIGAPLAVWAAKDFVYELRRFYRGITLEEIVLRNRFRITGEFIARLHNAFCYALFELHKLNIIHRDLQPRNILLTDQHKFVLLDSTLACEIGSPQFPVDSIYYTAPEQLNGQAVPGSDFFSLGAVEFFVSNGFPHAICTPEKYLTALLGISFGDWYSRGEVDLPDELAEELSFCAGAEFVAGLLSNEADRRPSAPWDLLLVTGTRALPSLKPKMQSILDLGELGFLVCGISDYEFVERKSINPFLTKMLSQGWRDLSLRIGESVTLTAAIESQLAGHPIWRL